MHNIDLFRDYENAKILNIDEYRKLHPGMTYKYSELSNREIEGIPICTNRGQDNELYATFIPDTHILAIGATRSGKTTGFVIPAINIMLSKKNKPSLVISDPKQELYTANAAKFKAQGYRVILLDFIDYTHSDCWNPLTEYYRLYQTYLHVEDTVEVVQTENGLRNRFNGKIFDSQNELDLEISEYKDGILSEVEKGITVISQNVVPIIPDHTDPFWDDSARNLFVSILYGMLEDSENPETGITEDNFSFDTVIRIFDSFSDSDKSYDRGYFRKRDIAKSRAYQMANKTIIEQAEKTRACISSSFAAKISRFRDTAVRRITSANTFEMKALDDDKPTVIFLSYKDEESLHYRVISMFLSNLYTALIGIARNKTHALDRPFYFMLDEFGNLPRFTDFDKVISACGGRNIWFLLILQSYAQLYGVYGKSTAEIIKDNLNTHIFFGTNNPETKREFSEECGRKTVIAPTSALNGSGESIERFDKDTVALIPVSTLNKIKAGECIVTQMRESVLWSGMERSYLCPEFDGMKANPSDRNHGLKFSDTKYRYDVLKYTSVSRKVSTSIFDYENTNIDMKTLRDFLYSHLGASVPILQDGLKISYSHASAIIQFAVMLNWLVESEDNSFYKLNPEGFGEVNPSNAKLREICKKFKPLSMKIFNLMSSREFIDNSDVFELSDTQSEGIRAIIFLKAENLICESGNKYYPILSRNAIIRLEKIYNLKHKKSNRDNNEDGENIKNIFEVSDTVFNDDDDEW